MISTQIPEGLTNYKLLKLFVSSILRKNLPEEETMAINNELSEQIEKLVWTVMYANCTDELRRKLSSLKESEVKEAVREIVKECSNNPKIKEEINHLLAKVLIDLNNEV